VPERINVKRDEESPATEQGNRRHNSAREEIPAPASIGRKTQVSHASHMADAKKWPEQKYGGKKDGAMKERFEIVSCEKREHAVRCK